MIRPPRRITVPLIGLLVVSWVSPVFAYLKFGVDVAGTSVTLKWKQTTIRYYVTDAGVPGVNAPALQAAAARAFAKWEAVPTATISYQFAGFTNALPGDDDGQSTLGFRSRPDLEGVLASTSYLIDDTTGELLESDIFFNSTFNWSVSAAGESNHFDLETIALHEIGHFSGLGHSALGETELGITGRRVISIGAVMFPIAFSPGTVSDRTLQADDIAGISDLYPTTDFTKTTGSISGRITLDGAGLFGAHVVAFDPSTGALVGNFALDDQGRFSIAGLKPGPQVVRIEPVDDADVGSFFDPDTPVNVDFRAAFYTRIVIVPRGGDSGVIEIHAEAK